MNSHVLYGMPASLYTGKVRAYLMQQGIAFEERTAGDPRFLASIVPQVGRWIIPVLECPDGRILQDGADIIATLEREGQACISALPRDPLLRVIARLFEWFGGEGLLRPAMHYRWNFDADNLPFLREDFGLALAAPGASQAERDERFERAAGRMRKAATSFGVTPESAPAIEAAYLEFLDLFNAHLAEHPFLLGEHPSLGDYGLYAPLHAHLGRDPHPARLMQQRAARVWRWTERMGQGAHGRLEYGTAQAAPLDAANLPDTLKALMRFIARDYLPECEAYVAYTNDWLARHPALATGSNGLERPGDRSIGMTTFNWRGHSLRVAVMPYRLYLLQQIQDEAASLGPESAGRWQRLLDETGLGALPRLTTIRRVERRQHLEVWGPVLPPAKEPST